MAVVDSSIPGSTRARVCGRLVMPGHGAARASWQSLP
ncbi:uncharacterized protein METZ01_LOCUS315400, partial [marine metagenome]